MYSTKIVLSNRPRKKDERYPVKLRVTINRLPYFYSTNKYLSKDEFDYVFSISKRNKSKLTKTQAKNIKLQLTNIEHKAIKILDAMEVPNFAHFKRLFTQRGSGGNVRKYFEQRISELKKENAFNTATTYENAQKSFEDKKGISTLNFKQITPSWLMDYHEKMIAAGKSRNTISIYTRCLRYLFNKAITDGVTPQKYYPFGKEKGKYQIPSSINNKRPLQPEEITALANYAGNPFHEYYRDFFLLSYYLIGLNFADLLTIKWKQIQGNTLTISRQKTAYQAKEQKISLHVTQKAWDIINKYANKDDEYIFDIANSTDPEKQKQQVRNFTRNCNQSLKKIAKVTGINANISSMFARHSAASHGLASGATIGDISELLGHTDIRTTNNYIKSLEDAGKNIAEFLEQNAVPKMKRETNDAEDSDE